MNPIRPEENAMAAENQMEVVVEVEEHPLTRRAAKLKEAMNCLSELRRNHKIRELKERCMEVEDEATLLYQEVGECVDIREDEAGAIKELVSAAKTKTETLLEILEGREVEKVTKDQEKEEEPVKVQKLRLMTFAGNLKEWKPFWQQFNACVGQRNYTPVNKMAQLLNSLRGEPKMLVGSYSQTSANYQVVVDILKERYGDPAKLAKVFSDELVNLTPDQGPQGEMKTLDQVKRILNDLRDLDPSLLQTETIKGTVMRKFSEGVLQATVRTLRKEIGPNFTLEDLLNALNETMEVQRCIDFYVGQKEPGPSHQGPSYQGTPRKKGTAAVLIGADQRKGSKCAFCEGMHLSEDCKRFPSLVARRQEAAKRNLCYICFKGGHRATGCKQAGSRCTHCRKTGHTIQACAMYLTAKGRRPVKGNFMQTFTTWCKGNNSGSSKIMLRGILDTGSQHSYIRQEAADKLGLKVQKEAEMSICSFGSVDPVSIPSGEVLVKFVISDSKERSFRFLTTPCITGSTEMLPSLDDVQRFLPDSCSYADADLFSPVRREIDLLVGNDLYYEFVTGELRKLPHNITLIKSLFGWIPSGTLSPTISENPSCSSILMSEEVVTENSIEVVSPMDQSILTNLWSLEALGIKTSENEENDDLVLQRFKETVRFENERFVVRWPWKSENPRIPSNFRMCMARLHSLFEHTSVDVLRQCDDVLKKQVSEGVIEFAPRHSPFLLHYLSMKPVLKNDKIRLVYDASAKTKSGHSLNSLLHRGPVLLEDLCGLLLNFRLEKVGVIADIEKAFLQIQLNEVDRDSVRFVWVKDLALPPTPDNLVHYRFKRVPFGVISSPFLLGIVLQELLMSPPSNDWLLASKNKFYVDNLVVSVKNMTSAVNFYEALTTRLQSASFRLRGWESNCQDFLTCIGVPESERVVSQTLVLGMTWNKETDTLSVKCATISARASQTSVTKREILSFLASVYDPLGLVAPSLVDLKLLVQQCWKQKVGWDKILPADVFARWLKLYSEAKVIASIQIPRRYWFFSGEGIYNLHIFCDASKKAYACCAYLTLSNTSRGIFASSLIFSKIRLSPIKEVSIPKLELMAVLIGKRSSTFLVSKLDVSISNVILWTDSTTVLQWLNSSTVLAKFVQNRVVEIRRSSNLTFRYVPTECNPADIASRGMKAEFLNDKELWWRGPQWLSKERLWPKTPPTTEVYCTPSVTLILNTPEYKGPLSDRLEKRFPSWNSCVRVFVHVLSLGSHRSKQFNLLNETERFQLAERQLIKELQAKYFSLEIAKLRKDSQPSPQLELFLDEYGIIRCKGHLQNVSFPWDTIHPILLPRESPLTRTYVRMVHVQNHHIGCNHLLAKVRERFWIVKGRAMMKSMIHKCVVCRMWEGGSYSLPPLPPLPLVGVAEASPFLHTGLDYLGPIHIENDHGIPVKAYVCLFVCLVTKAIHLELVRDLSADEFLMCFTRFTSRRGVPKFIISDNATNFVFVQPLVGQRVKISDYNVNTFLSSNNIRWSFIPQYAPWYGGAYERLVSLVKRSLKKSYGSILLDYVQVNTALCHIEDVINSRPLTYVGEEVLQPLTPNHFLRLRTCNAADSLEVSPLTSTRENLLQAFGHVKGVVSAFWDAFRSLYLLSLRERQHSQHPKKKGSSKDLPKKGDIVLIKEPSAPRSDWRFGVVKKLDKRQALAQVMSNKHMVTRSICQLFPLELSMDTSPASQ